MSGDGCLQMLPIPGSPNPGQPLPGRFMTNPSASPGAGMRLESDMDDNPDRQPEEWDRGRHIHSRNACLLNQKAGE